MFSQWAVILGSPEVAIGPPPLPPRPNTVCLLSENSFQEIDENNIRMERFRDYFAQYERFRDYFAHKRGSVIFIINNYANRPFQWKVRKSWKFDGKGQWKLQSFYGILVQNCVIISTSTYFVHDWPNYLQYLVSTVKSSKVDITKLKNSLK